MQRDRVINRLKALGFSFYRDAWRVKIFRNAQTIHEVHVPMRDDIDDEWVMSVLRQNGVSAEEARAFIECNRC